MPIDSGKDLLLALLALPGPSGVEGEPIQGTTRIEKMVFLFNNYAELRPFFEKFGFHADNYGPYSEKVVEDLETLQTLRLAEIKEVAMDNGYFGDELLAGGDGGAVSLSRPRVMREYRATRLGQLVARKLIVDADRKQIETLRSLKTQFNGVPLDSLVGFVYKTSDARFLEKSKIRDKYHV